MRDSQKQLILESLTAFFNRNPAYKRQLYEIITGISPVSLRLIDHFVTHYSKTANVLYWINDARGEIQETPMAKELSHLRKFHLYLEYRAQLKSYTKLDFDPFRRHKRITFVLETTPELVTVETTVGQLNFFRWALQNLIITFVKAHLVDIETSMSHDVPRPRMKHDSSQLPCIQGNQPTHRINAHCHIRFD